MPDTKDFVMPSYEALNAATIEAKAALHKWRQERDKKDLQHFVDEKFIPKCLDEIQAVMDGKYFVSGYTATFNIDLMCADGRIQTMTADECRAYISFAIQSKLGSSDFDITFENNRVCVDWLNPPKFRCE